MKKIKLFNTNKYALVDDEDFLYLNQFTWSMGKMSKTLAYPTKGNWKRGTWARMHNLLIKPPKGFILDHINRNGLDNRRNNLRVCTRSENQRNRKLQSNNKSGFRGVSWCKRGKVWRSYLKYDKKTHYLGSSRNLRVAARLWNDEARKIFGDFAVLNKI